MIRYDLQTFGGRGASSGAGAQLRQSQQSQPASPLESFQKSDGSGVDSVMQAVWNMDTSQNYYGNPDNYTQRLINHLGMHGAAMVLDDKTYDKSVKDNALGGVSLFRGVHDSTIYNSGRRVTLSASDIAQQTMFDDKNVIGKGIHGNGIYFTTDFDYAHAYAHTRRSKGAMMQGYIDKSKAKVITEGDLRSMAARDPVADKFGIDRSSIHNNFETDQLSQYAIYKGYNVIHVPGGNVGHNVKPGAPGTFKLNSDGTKFGEDFYVPLQKSVMVFREHSRTRKGKYL